MSATHSQTGFKTNLAEIRQIGRQIGKDFNPDKVILFGSYASNQAHADSDVDLLVIMPFRGKAVYQAARIRSGLKTGYPVDVIVHSREEIDTRLAEGDPFIQEIIEQGKILYEANNP